MKEEAPLMTFNEFLLVYLSKWRMILVVAVVTAGISAALSFVLPRTYRSSAGVLFYEPKTIAAFAMPNPFSVQTLERFIGSDAVKFRVLQQHPVKGWTIEDARRYMTADVLREKYGVEVKFSPLMLLSANAPSPEKAKELADAWAREVQLSSRIIRKDLAQRKLVEVELSLDVAERSLKAAEQRLSVLEPKITLNKAITDDALWNALVMPGATTRASDAAQASLQSEAINDVYYTVAREVETQAFKRDGLLAQKEALLQELKLLNEMETEEQILADSDFIRIAFPATMPDKPVFKSSRRFFVVAGTTLTMAFLLFLLPIMHIGRKLMGESKSPPVKA